MLFCPRFSARGHHFTAAGFFPSAQAPVWGSHTAARTASSFQEEALGNLLSFATVFLCSGSDGPVSLLTGSGNRNVVIDVNGGSTYVGVWARNFTGAASIRSESAAKP